MCRPSHTHTSHTPSLSLLLPSLSLLLPSLPPSLPPSPPSLSSCPSTLQFSRDYSLPYLEWRATIGLWVMVILIVFAISEISFLVTYFSRFSEEVFTCIVVCVFIYEASKNILDVRYICCVTVALHVTSCCM